MRDSTTMMCFVIGKDRTGECVGVVGSDDSELEGEVGPLEETSSGIWGSERYRKADKEWMSL